MLARMDKHVAAYAQEPRSSEELADCYLREGMETDDGSHAIATLHFRGGQTEFDLGKHFAESADPDQRAAGADILSQLGWDKMTFQDESVDLLIHLLNDPDANVVGSAAMALGHRNDLRAIPFLLPLVNHPDSAVRYGVVAGLSRHNDTDAITALIQLSNDEDDATRDWATFGLGSQIEFDSPALRDALVARLTDSDAEIRGEAMVGLARRADERVRPAIAQELAGPFHGDWSLEAAELLSNAEWLPLIEAQWKTLSSEERGSFGASFDAVRAACRAS